MKKINCFWIVLAIMIFQCNSIVFAQWHSIPQLKRGDIKCFLTVGDSTIFVAGSGGILLRSTNNGSDWMDIKGDEILADTILSLGKGGGYIFAGACGVSSVYRSSDNGDTWNAANGGLPYLAVANSFAWADSTLYLAADCGIFSSTDFGTSWKADTQGLSMELYYLKGITGITSVGSTLYAIKNLWSDVYTTSANNIVWTPIGLKNTGLGYAITSIDTNIFAGTAHGVYFYSGSGTDWIPRNYGLPEYFPDCILTAVDSLLFAYDGIGKSGIYVTSDLGQNWRKIKDSISTGKSVNAMAATKEYLFAATQSGAWRFSLTGLASSVDERDIQRLKGYVLNQNYPNPFNPETVISYQLSVISDMSLKIFDILGREVITLLNGKQSAGEYTVTWNGKNSNGRYVSSGVYYYQLTSNKGFRETKKMVLLR